MIGGQLCHGGPHFRSLSSWSSVLSTLYLVLLISLHGMSYMTTLSPSYKSQLTCCCLYQCFFDSTLFLEVHTMSYLTETQSDFIQLILNLVYTTNTSKQDCLLLYCLRCEQNLRLDKTVSKFVHRKFPNCFVQSRILFKPKTREDSLVLSCQQCEIGINNSVSVVTDLRMLYKGNN